MSSSSSPSPSPSQSPAANQMKLTELKAETIRRTMEKLHSESSGLLLLAFQWKDLEDHFDSARGEIQRSIAEADSKWKQVEEKEKKVDSLELMKERLGFREMEVMKSVEEVRLKETEFEAMRGRFETEKREFEDKCEELELREKSLEIEEREVSKRFDEVELKEKKFLENVNGFKKREREFEAKFKEIELKEQQLNEKEAVVSRKMIMIEKRECELDSMESVAATVKEELELREERLGLRKMELIKRIEEVQSKEKEFEVNLTHFEMEKRQLEEKFEEFESRATARVEEVELKEKNLEICKRELAKRLDEVQSKEKEFVENVNQLKRKERELEEKFKEIELKEEQFKELDRMKKCKNNSLTELGFHEQKFIDNACPNVVEPVPPSDSMVDDGSHDTSLRLCVKMDGKTLQMLLNDRYKDHETMGDEIFYALRLSRDPARLVLGALYGFFPPHLKKDNVEYETRVVRSSCVLLLEQLLKVKHRLRKITRTAARKLAVKWREKMKPGRESYAEVLGFLLLVAAFGLSAEFYKKELERLIGMVDGNLARQLYPRLGLSAATISVSEVEPVENNQPPLKSRKVGDTVATSSTSVVETLENEQPHPKIHQQVSERVGTCFKVPGNELDSIKNVVLSVVEDEIAERERDLCSMISLEKNSNISAPSPTTVNQGTRKRSAGASATNLGTQSSKQSQEKRLKVVQASATSNNIGGIVTTAESINPHPPMPCSTELVSIHTLVKCNTVRAGNKSTMLIDVCSLASKDEADSLCHKMEANHQATNTASEALTFECDQPQPKTERGGDAVGTCHAGFRNEIGSACEKMDATDKVSPGSEVLIVKNDQPQLKTERVGDTASYLGDDLKSICKRMDVSNLRSYLITHKKEQDLQKNVLNALQFASDPARLVYNVVQRFYLPTFGIIKVDANDAGCILLLEQLMELSPDIATDLKYEAAKCARYRKATFAKEGNAPVDVFGFFMFVAAFMLGFCFEGSELVALFGTFYNDYEVYRLEQNVKLCRALSLEDCIPGVVESLIKENKLLPAMRYVCAFNLANRFSLFRLLRLHVEAAENEVKKCKMKGKPTGLLRTELGSREILELRGLVKCISDCKWLKCKKFLTAVEQRIKLLEPEIAKGERKSASACLVHPKEEVSASTTSTTVENVTLKHCSTAFSASCLETQPPEQIQEKRSKLVVDSNTAASTRSTELHPQAPCSTAPCPNRSLENPKSVVFATSSRLKSQIEPGSNRVSRSSESGSYRYLHPPHVYPNTLAPVVSTTPGQLVIAGSYPGIWHSPIPAGQLLDPKRPVLHLPVLTARPMLHHPHSLQHPRRAS